MPQFPDRSDQLDEIYAPGFRTLGPVLWNEWDWIDSLISDDSLFLEGHLGVTDKMNQASERISDVVLPLIRSTIQSLSEVMIPLCDVETTNNSLGGLKFLLGQLEDNKFSPHLKNYLSLVQIVLDKLYVLAFSYSETGTTHVAEIKHSVSKLVQEWADFVAKNEL